MAAAGVPLFNIPEKGCCKTERPVNNLEFLRSSHFKISQDPHVTQPSLKSVFKIDYPPWDLASKAPEKPPPDPAEIFMKDTRYFNERLSETKKEYEYRSLDKPELLSDERRLRSTTFKMEKDDQFNSYQTTHHTDFPSRAGPDFSKAAPKLDGRKSHIPQGDCEKAPIPLSDYKDRFRGIDARLHAPEIAGNTFTSNMPTIQGDDRQHKFATTHNDEFRGVTLPKIRVVAAADYGSSIPQGDVDKICHRQTIHQASFPKHDPSALINYDRRNVTGQLQTTNFKQTDDRCNNYTSTFKDSYRPVKGPAERFPNAKSRNHSDFPLGDTDPNRQALRSNLTCNRCDFKEPAVNVAELPVTKKPPIVKGADKRTNSNVWFGEPTHATNFYDTTMKEDFTTHPIERPTVKRLENYKSSIPTDYYDCSHLDSTTYRTNFLKPKHDRFMVNPEAIENLKETHIKPPDCGERQFSTEHTDQYTAKTASTHALLDPRMLQKSSVPIGTLCI